MITTIPSTKGSPMKAALLSKFVGYAVSFVSLCVGAMLVLGLFIQTTVPVQLRIMLGVVFLLLGIYRSVVTYFRVRQDDGVDR